MKKIILISSVALLFAGSQICGCGSCSQANAQSPTATVVKNEIKTIKLKITGMTCAGCSNHVTQVLEAIKGVSNVELEYPGDVATIKYNSKTTDKEELIKAIEKINYKAEEVTDGNSKSAVKKKSCATSCGH